MCSNGATENAGRENAGLENASLKCVSRFPVPRFQHLRSNRLQCRTKMSVSSDLCVYNRLVGFLVWIFSRNSGSYWTLQGTTQKTTKERSVNEVNTDNTCKQTLTLSLKLMGSLLSIPCVRPSRYFPFRSLTVFSSTEKFTFSNRVLTNTLFHLCYHH